MARKLQITYCGQLRTAILRINRAINNLQRARNRTSNAAIRARLANNINTLVRVRNDKILLRNRTCR